MPDKTHSLDTVGRDLDRAREQVEATISSLRAVLDNQKGDLEPDSLVISRLERIAAEIATAERTLTEQSVLAAK